VRRVHVGIRRGEILACANDVVDVMFVSAGVGRTGVFIALSIVLERMRYEGIVDMFQTVKLLRTQRQGMIQSEVYNKCGLCSVPCGSMA